MDLLWKKISFDKNGRVKVTLEISTNGFIKGIWIREVRGSFLLARQIVSLLKRAQPYRDVMASFNRSMTFDMVFITHVNIPKDLQEDKKK